MTRPSFFHCGGSVLWHRYALKDHQITQFENLLRDEISKCRLAGNLSLLRDTTAMQTELTDAIREAERWLSAGQFNQRGTV